MITIFYRFNSSLNLDCTCSDSSSVCATPEEAYAQAQKALIMLSSSLNKGIEKVESVQEATGKIQENVNEQLNRLNNIKQ